MLIKCTCCGIEKPEAGFYRRSRKAGELLSGCRQCRAKKAKAKNVTVRARVASMSPAEILEHIAFDSEKGTFSSIETGEAIGCINSDGYQKITLLGINFRAHLIAWTLYHGSWPLESIDHQDHDRANNKRENLRLAGSRENARNMSLSRRNKSGVVGVCWLQSRNKWMAQIHEMVGAKRKNHILGQFSNFEQAVEARKLAEIRFGYHKNHGAICATQ